MTTPRVPLRISPITSASWPASLCPANSPLRIVRHHGTVMPDSGDGTRDTFRRPRSATSNAAIRMLARSAGNNARESPPIRQAARAGCLSSRPPPVMCDRPCSETSLIGFSGSLAEIRVGSSRSISRADASEVGLNVSVRGSCRIF